MSSAVILYVIKIAVFSLSALTLLQYDEYLLIKLCNILYFRALCFSVL
nr:MAG TPA: hypothetical protein [Bacteriophage sp.]